MRGWIALWVACRLAAGGMAAQEAGNATVMPIDLPTALRLADAQNLDVQIARERLREAQAEHRAVRNEFFPWLEPGVGFRGHNGKIPNVEGRIIDADKYSYAPGVAVNAQWTVGETWFKALAAKQLEKARQHAVEAVRQQTVLDAARGYYDLALAAGRAAVARGAVRLSADYEAQLLRAVEAGIALKTEVFRARVQKENNGLSLRQALEEERVASARLVQVLRLDPMVRLEAQQADLSPLELATAPDLPSLIGKALAQRPELRQSGALVAAAEEGREGAVYGPMVPTLGATAFVGGQGGGPYGEEHEFGSQVDYFIGAHWRVGPGGLLDTARIDASEARLKQAQLTGTKLQDELSRQVVEAHARWESQKEQIGLARDALAAAEEGFLMAQQRKEFAVSAVLETILAEREFTGARTRYLQAVAGYNQAQYELKRAVGDL
jgi:outer membrane protein TolC